jgi:predicted outer membrane repeat protein
LRPVHVAQIVLLTLTLALATASAAPGPSARLTPARALGFAAAVAAEAPAAAGAGGVLRVPQDVPTLDQAISQVADGGIVELAAGAYAAPAAGFKISNLGKSFTIRAALGNAVALDGGGAHPVVVLRNSARSRGGLIVFQDLAFRNGGGGSSTTSPGVTVDAGEARFVGCRFENNAGAASADGGGVKVRNGSDASFVGCSFAGNSSPVAGGAMMINLSSVEVLGGSFTGNLVNPPNHDPSSHGGAIDVIDGTLRVSDTLFQGNQAGFVGGAIFAIGDWTGNPARPSSSVSINRSTFDGNAIAPQPCCPPPGPPTGGAIHVEDQTTLDVKSSRFVGNQAQFGGAIDSYRALVNVSGSTFQGNRGAATGANESIGGAICALSNDFVDASTAGGRNPRPAGLTVSGSLLQGNQAGGPVANAGGCILAGGDENHLYGLGGLAPNGTPDSNRAQVAIAGSVFHDCGVQQSPGVGGGAGGAINGSLVALAMDGSLVLDSSAAGNGSGGGIYLADESDARISGTTFAGNSADTAGGAIFAGASNLQVSGSRFVGNQVGSSRGAALYSIPARGGQPHVGPGDASGAVSGTSFSQDLGLAVWDVDAGGRPGLRRHLRRPRP